MESAMSSSKFGRSSALSISKELMFSSSAGGKIVESLSKLAKSNPFLSLGRLFGAIESVLSCSKLAKLKLFSNSSGFLVSEEKAVSLLKLSKLKSMSFFSLEFDKSKSTLWLSESFLFVSFEIKGVLSNPSKSKSILLSGAFSEVIFSRFSACFSKLILGLPDSKSSASLKSGISILKSSPSSSSDLFGSVFLEKASLSSSKVESGIIL